MHTRFQRSAFSSADLSTWRDSDTWTQGKSITTYRRPAASSPTFGSVDNNDLGYKIATSGNYTQVIYKGSGKWKLAWVLTSGIKTREEILAEIPGASSSLAEMAYLELGYQGLNENGTGHGDYTKYGKYTGTDGQHWCAAFVAWCANEAGVSRDIVPRVAGCVSMPYGSSALNYWDSNAMTNIKKDDVIFFSKAARNIDENYHVGIVYAVDKANNSITIIEGNTGDDVVRENT